MDAAHLSVFASVLGRTQTPEIALWDADAYARAVGWGAYFEKLVEKVRPRLSKSDSSSSSAAQGEDDAWLRACLNDSGALEKDLNAEWVQGFWAQIRLDDLRCARTRLVDRYILHSPFIDANPALIRLVLDRAAQSDGGAGPGRSAIATLLDERHAVDNALAAAHESLEILRSVKNKGVSTEGGTLSKASP